MEQKSSHTVLFVDDEESITKSLKSYFRKEPYTIYTASGGQEGLDVLKKIGEPVSLIISDQRMPGMTGSVFLEKSWEIFPDAIRFLLTGYSDIDAVVDAINKGKIHRYLSKPWNDDDLVIQVRQSLEQYELELENRRLLVLTQKQNKQLYDFSLNLNKEIKKGTREIEEKNRQLEEGFIDTIRLLTTFIEAVNPVLGKYMRHTAKLSKKVAIQFGLDNKEVDAIEMAGMIHDIGFLGMPQTLFEKSEKEMKSDEFVQYSHHPIVAYLAVQTVEKLIETGKIILHHHEHLDGSGFPDGLTEHEMPVGSKIIGAASYFCRIIHTWPKEMHLVNEKVKRAYNFSPDDVKSPSVSETIRKIAEKALLMEANAKYDLEIIAKLLKLDGEIQKVEKSKKVETVSILALREGMTLAEDLLTVDGKLLLSEETMLKEGQINSIVDLLNRNLVDNKIGIIDTGGGKG